MGERTIWGLCLTCIKRMQLDHGMQLRSQVSIPARQRANYFLILTHANLTDPAAAFCERKIGQVFRVQCAFLDYTGVHRSRCVFGYGICER